MGITSRESGFHVWIILVIVAAVLVIGLLIWRFLDASGINLAGKLASTGFGSEYQCEDKPVKFTSPPMKMEDLGYIRPLGAMLDGHVTPTDHVYVGPIDSEVPDNTYAVLMPADGKVVEVGRMPSEYVGDRDFTPPEEDHRIVLMFSCRYFSIFIHVHKLADKVKEALGDIEPGNSKQVSVELKAGEVLGYIGGDTFDWTPIDNEVTLEGFITPELYKVESWKIHTVSPFDLYTDDLKTQLSEKSWRTAPPVGGKIDYDQPGKLIGNWFREGTNGYEGANQERYWDGHLSVVPDYIDPNFTVVSIGNWKDNKAMQLIVDDSPDVSRIGVDEGMQKFVVRMLAYTDNGNANFRGNVLSHDIKPGFHQPVEGVIAFQVLPGEKLKVEKFVGKTLDEVTGFTSAAQIYER